MEGQLKNRVQEYYRHVLREECSLEWDFLRQDMKRRWKREEWANYSKSFNSKSKLLSYQIKSISINKVQNIPIGKVTIVVKHKLIQKNKVEQYEGDEIWIFEEGDWFRHLEPW